MGLTENERNSIEKQVADLKQQWEDLEDRSCELDKVLDGDLFSDTNKSVYSEFLRVDDAKDKIERKIERLEHRLHSD